MTLTRKKKFYKKKKTKKIKNVRFNINKIESNKKFRKTPYPKRSFKS